VEPLWTGFSLVVRVLLQLQIDQMAGPGDRLTASKFFEADAGLGTHEVYEITDAAVAPHLGVATAS
jgi:hypothetical protein